MWCEVGHMEKDCESDPEDSAKEEVVVNGKKQNFQDIVITRATPQNFRQHTSRLTTDGIGHPAYKF